MADFSTKIGSFVSSGSTGNAGIPPTKWTSNRKLGRPEFFWDKKLRAAKLAEIPPELAAAVADYAEILLAEKASA